MSNLVHYVKVKKKLPTGETIRCEVCRDGGLAYHRTTTERLAGMVKDQLLNPLACQAQVLSLSRKRDQGIGGNVLLVFSEKSLRGKREMCYVHMDDQEKLRRASKILNEALTRHDGATEIPVTRLHAFMGVTRFGYRKECEVMLDGCLPIQNILKIEYWISTSFDPSSPLHELLFHADGECMEIRSISKVKAIADQLGKPFEVKSCTPGIKWRDEHGSWVWAYLNHKNLTKLANGEWPLESDGVAGLYGAVRWDRSKARLENKCRRTPPSPYKELRKHSQWN